MNIKASIITRDGENTYSYSTYHVLKRMRDGSFIWAYSRYTKNEDKDEDDILQLELDISREIKSSCFDFKFEPEDLNEYTC